MQPCAKPREQIKNQIKSAWLKDLTRRTAPVQLEVTTDGAQELATFVDAVAEREHAKAFGDAVSYIVSQLKSDLEKTKSERAVIVATTYYLKSRSVQSKVPTKVPRTGLFVVRTGLHRTKSVGPKTAVLRVPSYRDGTGLYKYRGAKNAVCENHATAAHTCAITCPKTPQRKDLCSCHKHLYCRDHQHGDDVRLARELDHLLKEKQLTISGSELQNSGKKTTRKVFTEFVKSMNPTEGQTDIKQELARRLAEFEAVYANKIFAKAACATCTNSRGCRRSRSKRKIAREQDPKLRSELGRPYIPMRRGVFFDINGGDLSKTLLDRLDSRAATPRQTRRAVRTESPKRAESSERPIERQQETPTVRRSTRLAAKHATGLSQPRRVLLVPTGFGFV
jgi:hypothetical protein